MKSKKVLNLEEHQKGQLAAYRVVSYLGFEHFNLNNWSQLLSFSLTFYLAQNRLLN